MKYQTTSAWYWGLGTGGSVLAARYWGLGK